MKTLFAYAAFFIIVYIKGMIGVTSQPGAYIRIGINTGITENQLHEFFKIIDVTVGKDFGNIARTAPALLFILQSPGSRYLRSE
jgi:hypothetical protein